MLLLLSTLAACLLTETTLARFEANGNSGWHGISSYGVTNYGTAGLHQDLSSFNLFPPYNFLDNLQPRSGNEFNIENIQHMITQSMPISEHVEVTKPIVIPILKNIGVPVAQAVPITVPHPVAIAIPQPYPVHVPVSQPIAVPIVKTIAIPVEKKVPYPVEKIIPVPVERAVPIRVEKHIPVPVEKPYPIHIPVYKHIFHRKKKSHRHGWRY